MTFQSCLHEKYEPTGSQKSESAFGAKDHSPPIYRWVSPANGSESRQGRQKMVCRPSFVPDGTHCVREYFSRR